MKKWTDETAQWYIDRYGEYATNQLIIETLPLFEGICLLDLGCGTGAALRHAASRLHSARLIGIDPVPRMITTARARATQYGQRHPERPVLEVYLGSAEAIPTEDHIADMILALDSLDHWAHIPKGLAEVQRVLKYPGCFVIGKDDTVPGRACKELEQLLQSAGLFIEKEQCLRGEVSCKVWITRPVGTKVT